MPSGCPIRDGRRIDWGAELGVVIGSTGRSIGPDHITGYVVLNDVTSRDLLARTDAVAAPFGFDWTSAKGGDTFCPMGPDIRAAAALNVAGAISGS